VRSYCGVSMTASKSRGKYLISTSVPRTSNNSFFLLTATTSLIPSRSLRGGRALHFILVVGSEIWSDEQSSRAFSGAFARGGEAFSLPRQPYIRHPYVSEPDSHQGVCIFHLIVRHLGCASLSDACTRVSAITLTTVLTGAKPIWATRTRCPWIGCFVLVLRCRCRPYLVLCIRGCEQERL